ncbi:MAG TPA: hypothetical protein VLJ59_19455 [Mycobacteriales bacterium]|nr:hypothetical protein [Mycobacteriales bacterium]
MYAGIGDEAATAQARDTVAKLGCDYQYLANIQLHQARCTVIKGDIDQGVRQAAMLLSELPAPHRGSMITETGRMVLRAVPRDRQDRPAAADLREVLAATPAQ